jgi:hypothetical protein
VTGQMIQQQRGDLLGGLVGGVVADAGEGGELVVGGDEFAGALGRRPADSVVGVG